MAIGEGGRLDNEIDRLMELHGFKTSFFIVLVLVIILVVVILIVEIFVFIIEIFVLIVVHTQFFVIIIEIIIIFIIFFAFVEQRRSDAEKLLSAFWTCAVILLHFGK